MFTLLASLSLHSAADVSCASLQCGADAAELCLATYQVNSCQGPMFQEVLLY